MTIVSYLGCNFHLPLSKDDDDEQVLVVEDVVDVEAREDVKRQFSTKYNYIYEILTSNGSGIWFNKHYKKDYPKSNRKSKESFLALCQVLGNNLQREDYCELYICWSSDEGKDRNVSLNYKKISIPFRPNTPISLVEF